MDATKTVLRIIIFLLVNPKHRSNAQSSFEKEKYFKKIYDHGNSLKQEEIVSSYSAHCQVDCSFKCLQEQFCVGYNYRSKSKKDEINCETSRNISLESDTNSALRGEWMLFQALENLPTYSLRVHAKVINGWTLIARFSNNDSKHWTDDGVFWYDRTTPYGDVNDPIANIDMISSSFWELKGSEFRITRSDDLSHTALLQTTSNCLQGATFRSKLTSYGNFRSRAVWASNRCRGSCSVIYGGQYKTTAGFEQHSCSSNIQSSDYIGFWCDWSSGDGAVMMIGGGGSSCGRADHGIGITEEGAAQFGGTKGHYDFGRNANYNPPSTYSLNLWVR